MQSYKLHFVLSQTKQCSPTPYLWTQPPYAIAATASKEKRLSTRCTFRGHTACPQESHLISSSLHVINLPPQCYCSHGHSSSFREKGIDQASLRNAFVHAVNREKKKSKTVRCIQNILSVLCTRTCTGIHVWKGEGLSVCVCVCCRSTNSRIRNVFLLNAACVDIDVLTNTAGLTLITMEAVVDEYITIVGCTGDAKKVTTINQQGCLWNLHPLELKPVRK